MINQYENEIKAALPFCLTNTNLTYGQKYEGKVRDTYDLGDKLALVTTDRLSAFDRVLASVPYKGAVLNLISAWWFEKSKHIVPNHVVAVPDPNVVIGKKCEVLPIEFVVRQYISGTTSTSLWTQYHQGVREYCGIQFPEGLRKNQKLPHAILTPTTKDKVHDKPISPADIIAEGWLSQKDWETASEMALTLFEFGSKIAQEHGLILVDTKYEFGKDATGNILVIDEIHTPDSSRYWLSHHYVERFKEGLEPENIDKEFLRLWFAKNCDPYNDDVLPQAPEELIVTLSSRYIELYERITNEAFPFAKVEAMEERMVRNVDAYLRQ